MPIETYYGNSSDEHNDLLELRKVHYDTLHELRLQAARYGGAVPSHIATGIKEAEASIRAIDDKLRSPIDSTTVQQLGDTGRFAVVTGRLDHLAEQIRLMQAQSDEWRVHRREEQLATTRADRRERQKLTRQVAQVVKQVGALEGLQKQVGALEERQDKEDHARAQGQKFQRMLLVVIGVALLLVAVAVWVLVAAVVARLI